MSKILVTGGAGFIGSHIVDKLIEKNHEVTIVDNLEQIPDYLNPNAKLIKGDIKDRALLNKLIPNFKVIFHNAAAVGISQSNYEVRKFIENNILGTAILLQSIIDSEKRPKLILSSSNTTYGEGLYFCHNCNFKFHPSIRTQEQINRYGFETVCPKCKNPSKPIPTPEKTSLNCNSIYAYTKKTQEELFLFLGKLYNFPVVILKYFNVFGPRQSLSNPYTGVSAIFTSRIKNNNPVILYEDGLQTRDFIYVDDIVDANMRAMENSDANYEIFNLGSGVPITIKSIAEEIYKLFNKAPDIQINNKFRKGDIRHCIADNSKARTILKWCPKTSFEQGLKNLFEWSKSQESKDNFEKADSELKEKGLI